MMVKFILQYFLSFKMNSILYNQEELISFSFKITFILIYGFYTIKEPLFSLKHVIRVKIIKYFSSSRSEYFFKDVLKIKSSFILKCKKIVKRLLGLLMRRGCQTNYMCFITCSTSFNSIINSFCQLLLLLL